MSKRFPDIKSVTDLRNWLRDTHPKLDDCVEDKQSALRIGEVCAMELADLERERDALLETVKSLSNKFGEIALPGTEVNWTKIGDAANKQTGFQYDFGILNNAEGVVDPASRAACVLSQKTGKMWVLNWRQICAIAVSEGVDR
jgi:hypothetical protein